MNTASLFAKEEAVIAAAQDLLDKGTLGDDQAAFEALLKDYAKLYKTTKRFMRLSDRNETALNAMAERERAASGALADKNAELEVLSGKLSKYLSPQVYASIFSGEQKVELAAQRKKLTVFFSDIAYFSDMTEKLESEDLTNVINHYLTEMSKVALEHGATIDKYIGDGIMIFFGDPETRGVREDALACVNMSIAMQKRMAELQADWRNAGIESPLAIRIGIATGYCTVGNFGSTDRMDYTILGGTVNLASRLEQLSQDGGILIGYETYALVKEEIHCIDAGKSNVKGLPYPVASYQVIDRIDNMGDSAGRVEVDLPNFQLEANMGLMDRDGRARAQAALQEALKRLANLPD